MAIVRNASTRIYHGNEWHAAPDGLPPGPNGGTGSSFFPWDIRTAFTNADGRIQPGDIVWIHGGLYAPGPFQVTSTGAAELPIIYRVWPGDRAQFDGWPGYPLSTTRAIEFGTQTNYVWVWGIEVFNTGFEYYGTRLMDYRTAGIVAGLGFSGDNLTGGGTGVKFINNIVHDNDLGLTGGVEGSSQEAYGNIFYYNGADFDDGTQARGGGHMIYTQNQFGDKVHRDNIGYSGHGYGWHCYSSEAWLASIVFEGNMNMMAGNLSHFTGLTSNLWGGSGAKAPGPGTSDKILLNPVLKDNCSYRNTCEVGYNKGTAWPHIIGNWCYGSSLASTSMQQTLIAGTPAEIHGNRFVGSTNNTIRAVDYPDNEFYSAKPTTNWIRVRPNLYERGRGHICVYNWQGLNTVDVDISSFGLRQGEAFQIRPVQGVWTPVVEDTYSSPTVTLPMVGLPQSLPMPASWGAPSVPGIEFQIFVCHRTGTGGF